MPYLIQIRPCLIWVSHDNRNTYHRPILPNVIYVANGFCQFDGTIAIYG